MILSTTDWSNHIWEVPTTPFKAWDENGNEKTVETVETSNGEVQSFKTTDGGTYDSEELSISPIPPYGTDLADFYPDGMWGDLEVYETEESDSGDFDFEKGAVTNKTVVFCVETTQNEKSLKLCKFEGLLEYETNNDTIFNSEIERLCEKEKAEQEFNEIIAKINESAYKKEIIEKLLKHLDKS